jgi:hypothetical protein
MATQAQDLASIVSALSSGIRDALKQPGNKSVISIRPNIQFPSLTDEDMDVEGFLERFDELVNLANDGTGLPPREAIHILQNCIKGKHRRLAFSIVMKTSKQDGTWETDPASVLAKIREELVRFSNPRSLGRPIRSNGLRCWRGTGGAP